MNKIILITGGQRSGKSAFAEQLALKMSDSPVYLATAHVWDEEFRQRVVRHQQRRGNCWTNIEEEKWLSRHDFTGRTVLIDCITLWCTNFFFDDSRDGAQLPDVEMVLQKVKNEFDLLTSQEATFIFVTNEIGSGGVSDNAVQRRFTDLEGWMNQYVASLADTVILMVSGIPVVIKGELPPSANHQTSR
jgi:adenosylcobinamide kinase/adenosylcobinamide-phosphate guanylyltransferase